MPNIDEITRRPMSYVEETGVPWLASGLVFSLLGGSTLIQRFLSPDYKLMVQWVTLGGAAGVFWAAWKLNHKVVFPRGGYVEPAHLAFGIREWVYMGLTLAGIGAMFLTLRIVTKADWSQLSGPAFAVCFAAICAGAGRQMKRPKMYWFAVYLLCLGALLFWIRLSLLSMAALQFGIGAPLAVIGAIRLRRFIKDNPRVEDGGE